MIENVNCEFIRCYKMCFSLDEFQLKDWKWLDRPSSEIALLLVLLRDWALVEVHIGQGGGGGGDSRRRSWTWSWERAACGAWAGSWDVLHLGRVVVSKRRCWRKLGAKVWDLRSAGGSSWRTRLFTFYRSSLFCGQYFNSHLQNKHISHNIFLKQKNVFVRYLGLIFSSIVLPFSVFLK